MRLVSKAPDENVRPAAAATATASLLLLNDIGTPPLAVNIKVAWVTGRLYICSRSPRSGSLPVPHDPLLIDVSLLLRLSSVEIQRRKRWRKYSTRSLILPTYYFIL